MGRGLRWKTAAAGALLAAAVWRIGREVAAYRKSASRLGANWAEIPAMVGAETLRMWVRAGSGKRTRVPRVVLVHGYGVGSGYLVPLAAHLAKRVDVYVPELPGHGRSDHDDRPLTIPELAAALTAWMDAKKVGPALLVGHSLGCQVAAEVALRRPALVAGLILVGPTSTAWARTVPLQLGRGMAASLFDRPTYAALALSDYARAGLRVLACEMREMVEHRIEDILPRLSMPVRVVRGGRDALVPAAWAARVAWLAGAPPPAVVPGWGRAVHYDDPAAIAAEVLRLARSVSAASVHPV